jgi:hypothetical protein
MLAWNSMCYGESHAETMHVPARTYSWEAGLGRTSHFPWLFTEAAVDPNKIHCVINLLKPSGNFTNDQV